MGSDTSLHLSVFSPPLVRAKKSKRTVLERLLGSSPHPGSVSPEHQKATLETSCLRPVRENEECRPITKKYDTMHTNWQRRKIAPRRISYHVWLLFRIRRPTSHFQPDGWILRCVPSSAPASQQILCKIFSSWDASIAQHRST